jgi:hypothetical protein
MTFVTLAVEGICDERALRKIVEGVGFDVAVTHNCRGKSKLDARVPGYLQAALYSPWVILRDLDQDAQCAPEFIASRGITPPITARFRVAVRSLEAWLLADRTNISRYLGVAVGALPNVPDVEAHPKTTMANLAARSRRRAVRDRMAPRPDDGAQIGPEYEAALIEFIDNHWDFRKASERSNSLAKAIVGIETLFAACQQG